MADRATYRPYEQPTGGWGSVKSLIKHSTRQRAAGAVPGLVRRQPGAGEDIGRVADEIVGRDAHEGADGGHGNFLARRGETGRAGRRLASGEGASMSAGAAEIKA
jgi:hypothetical protein